MAQVLNLSPPVPSKSKSFLLSSEYSRSTYTSWSSLQRHLQCKGRFLCLFSDNKREEEARKALEGALSGKKNEFERWDKEIKRREELGGGGNAGGGGWFGSGGWFGWYNDDNFWQEAKQASLTVLGIVLIYLIVAKGELLLAVILNPLLYALRGTRNGFSFITSKILKITNGGNQSNFDGTLNNETYQRPSAKENVMKKWGSD